MHRVGTSGFQYADWRGRLYPEGVPVRRWLETYAESFSTVELNAPFYRLPERATFERWRARVPDDFRYATKASRFLTHVKRLREPAEPVARLMDRVAGLGPKAGPILLQLPPTSRADPPLLADCLAQFPAGTQVAVEPREASWFTDATYDVLAAADAALVWADRGGEAVGSTERTAGWGYLRLHRDADDWAYRDAVLERWARLVGDAWDDSWTYFNNDPGCAAPGDAQRFRAFLGGAR